MVFGWTGGTKLVKDSYEDAKGKKEEMSEQRREKKEAKRGARSSEARSGLLGVFRRSPGDESAED